MYMTLLIQSIGLSCIVVIFSLGCSPESESRRTKLNTDQEVDRAVLDHSASHVRTNSPVAVEEELSHVDQAERPFEQSNDRMGQNGDYAGQGSNEWKKEDRPWTTAEVFSIIRPLDFDRLASGIRQKYELEELDDPRLELEELLRLFEAGDSSVVFDLGLFLAYGDDMILDPVRAIEFFEEAAINGEVRALAELGRMYLVGLGVSRDATRAESYFRQAMERGDPEGAFLLGASNRLGLLEDSDEEMGMAYLETAAEYGHDAAAIALLFVNIETDGYSKLSNDEKTEAKRLARERLTSYTYMEKWLLDAAETGDVNSINALARYYSVFRDRDKTLSAYETAAELGSFIALNKLIDIRARELRNPEFRDSMKELVSIHIEKGGPRLGEMKFLMALLEGFTASNAESSAKIKELLGDAKTLGHNKSFVAMSLIESGEPAPKALMTAKWMNAEDAYLRRIEIGGQSNSGEGEYGSPTVPKLVEAVEHKFPAELNAESITGEVRVEFLVDKNGRISRIEAVESTHPAFAESAIEAISKYRFSPAPGMETDAVKFSILVEYKR